MNTVYLVRHAENPANITKEFSCRKVDYPLTQKGILQAQQTAVYFRDERIDAIYSSPLKRAVQTAEIIGNALDLPVTVIEHFREMNVGDLEDGPPTLENWAFHDRIVAEWLRGSYTVAFPGGEDYLTLLDRMRAGLTTALRGREDQRIVIVGHGGIFTATIGALCPNASLPEILRHPSHNCSVSIMEMEHATNELVGTLRSWASCDHISGDAADFVFATPTEPARQAR